MIRDYEKIGKPFLASTDRLVAQVVCLANPQGVLIQYCRTDTGGDSDGAGVLVCSAIEGSGYVVTAERLAIPQSLSMEGLLCDAESLVSSGTSDVVGGPSFIVSNCLSQRKLCFSPNRTVREEALLQYVDRWLLVVLRCGVTDAHCVGTISYFRGELFPLLCQAWEAAEASQAQEGANGN